MIWNFSHLMIFPLQLLGPAIGFSADPSSSKGKIMSWVTTTNSSNNKQMSLLDVIIRYSLKIWIYSPLGPCFSSPAFAWASVKPVWRLTPNRLKTSSAEILWTSTSSSFFKSSNFAPPLSFPKNRWEIDRFWVF